MSFLSPKPARIVTDFGIVLKDEREDILDVQAKSKNSSLVGSLKKRIKGNKTQVSSPVSPTWNVAKDDELSLQPHNLKSSGSKRKHKHKKGDLKSTAGSAVSSPQSPKLDNLHQRSFSEIKNNSRRSSIGLNSLRTTLFSPSKRTSQKKPIPLFGIPLEGSYTEHSFVSKLTQFIINHSQDLEEELIKKVSKRDLKESFAQDYVDENLVSLLPRLRLDANDGLVLLKIYLEELPQSLCTSDMHEIILDCIELEASDKHLKVEQFKLSLEHLPKSHTKLLGLLTTMISILGKLSECKISVSFLSAFLGPAIVRKDSFSHKIDLDVLNLEVSKVQSLLTLLVKNATCIFCEKSETLQYPSLEQEYLAAEDMDFFLFQSDSACALKESSKTNKTNTLGHLFHKRSKSVSRPSVKDIQFDTTAANTNAEYVYFAPQQSREEGEFSVFCGAENVDPQISQEAPDVTCNNKMLKRKKSDFGTLRSTFSPKKVKCATEEGTEKDQQQPVETEKRKILKTWRNTLTRAQSASLTASNLPSVDGFEEIEL